MPLLKKRAKRDVEINSSATADIAFLLLIFFLVTTTIDADKGIYMQLPPKIDVNNPPPEIRQRNLLNVLVAQDGNVLIDNELTQISQIRDLVKRHVTNNGQNPDLSENPQKAVVSFKTERGLRYETYIEVLDELKSAYNDIRNEYAQQLAGVDYGVYRTRLGDEDVDEVAAQYPVKLSLAEPDPG